jgi:hypothetical protein
MYGKKMAKGKMDKMAKAPKAKAKVKKINKKK